MWRDSETELDFLDFDYLVELLKDTISNESLLPSSIGVYGDWGSGKSSLIKMSMTKLSSDDEVCLLFNGWLFEGYEDAKTALIGSILDTIKEKRTLGDNAKKCLKALYKSVDKMKIIKSGVKYGLDFLLTGGIGTLADITMNSIASKLIDGNEIVNIEKLQETMREEFNNQSLRDDIKEFRVNFERLLNETKIKKLVVFIDELDRCSPDTILETLEAIRLFLFVNDTAFIIGADERHIAYAVKQKFNDIEGLQIDIGKEYLEKLVQYPIRIPRLNEQEVEYYITCLLIQNEMAEESFNRLIDFLKEKKREDFIIFKLNYNLIEDQIKNEDSKIIEKVKESIVLGNQLAKVLAHGLNGNPRQCKRFLNTISMRIKTAGYRGIALDRRILAKLMLVEYFKLPLFKKIISANNRTTNLKEEFGKLENNELNQNDEFEMWKDDEWVINWAKSEPLFSNIDLMPYLFFSRTMQEERYSVSIKNNNPKMKEILDLLLKNTDISIRKACNDHNEITPYEKGLILDEIYSTLIVDSVINSKLFKGFMDWGQIDDSLYDNLLSNLRSIPNEKIKFTFIPLVEAFGVKSNKQSEVQELIKQWATTNDSIKKLVDRKRE